MIRVITRAFVLLFALCSVSLPALQTVAAQDVDVSISTQTKGLSVEFPVTSLNGELVPKDPVLASVKFGGQQPLLISEKKGLDTDTPDENILSVAKTSPSPAITPRDPLLDPTPATVVIQESAVQSILGAFPTPTALPTLKPTLAPTIEPEPTAVPTAKPVTSDVQLSNGGLNADTLFAMSNAHRQSIGLPAFEKDARACSLAVERAPEIAAEIANGNMHAGMYGRNLPYWNTENIISMGSEQGAFNWWLNDGIHRAAIEGDYKYSCVACQGNNCAQEFTNFQPK